MVLVIYCHIHVIYIIIHNYTYTLSIVVSFIVIIHCMQSTDKHHTVEVLPGHRKVRSPTGKCTDLASDLGSQYADLGSR